MTFAAVLAASTPQQIEDTKLLYLGAAFALAWVGITLYMFWLFRRQSRLEKALEKIQARDNGEQTKLAADNKTTG